MYATTQYMCVRVRALADGNARSCLLGVHDQGEQVNAEYLFSNEIILFDYIFVYDQNVRY